TRRMNITRSSAHQSSWVPQMNGVGKKSPMPGRPGAPLCESSARTGAVLWLVDSVHSCGSWARAHPRSHAECNHRDDRQRATSIVAASNRAPAGAIWLEPYRIPTPGRTAQAAEEGPVRSEEHTSELQSRENLVCRLLLEK